MRSKPTRCDVVILPPKKISRGATFVSRKLKSLGGLFMLDDRNHIPHITLYMADFPSKNISSAVQLLQRMLSHARPIAFETAKHNQTKGGYVDVGFKRTRAVQNLQRDIIQLLNHLREDVPAHRSRSRELNHKERDNIIRYGYPAIGPLFRPHLTFTKLASRAKHKNVISSLPKENFSFTAKNIGLCLVGPHGTCREIVAKFNLR